jgi:hypothetical protein
MRNLGSSNGGGSNGGKQSFNSASVVTLSTSTVEKWNPTSYSIGRTGFNISNQNPQGYHPFCFSQSGYDPDTRNKVSTSDFKENELFREDKNSFPGQNIFTCYSFPYLTNIVLIVAHLDNKFFSSPFISTQSWIRNQQITSPYLFRFFDDTNCGCSLPGYSTSVPNCPGDKKADPGAIIFLDRSSEINTVSLNYPEYVTRPLSNAILDYCNKNNITPQDLMPNLLWDEELQYF